MCTFLDSSGLVLTEDGAFRSHILYRAGCQSIGQPSANCLVLLNDSGAINRCVKVLLRILENSFVLVRQPVRAVGLRTSTGY